MDFARKGGRSHSWKETAGGQLRAKLDSLCDIASGDREPEHLCRRCVFVGGPALGAPNDDGAYRPCSGKECKEPFGGDFESDEYVSFGSFPLSRPTFSPPRLT